ncbi:O-antigen ligase family protein [Desulfobulbus elongatus]|uniref:O-antigen ligase family protein n=1 Tax=Desulfobulbus elongatus TaxID=53332 RepID=UPI000488AAED|nr:O-antigen ligase family protein [Desulfobulbus elongatus]
MKSSYPPQHADRQIIPFLLILAILFFKFISFPVINTFGFAPENFLFLLLGFILIFFVRTLVQLKGSFLIIILFFLFYSLEFIINLLQGDHGIGFIPQIKSIFMIIGIATFCSNEQNIVSAIKFFVVLATFSVVFGLLVYFIGEPFISIRQWFTASSSTAETIFIGKGSQLTGLYCVPHVFGYMMAAVPILCFTLFLAEKRFFWMGCLLVCSIGLLLNAERSALLMNIVVFGLVFWRQKNRFLLLPSLVLCVIAVLLIQHVFVSRSQNVVHLQEASYRSGSLSDRMKKTTSDEVVDRIKWQLHGIRAVLKHPLTGATQSEYAHEVYAEKMDTPSQRQVESALASHNHYVNVGLKTGIWGWMILAILLWRIAVMLRSDMAPFSEKQSLATIALGVKLSVIATMGNAVFHNNGLFSSEFASSTVLAFLMAIYGMVQSCQPTRPIYAAY